MRGPVVQVLERFPTLEGDEDELLARLVEEYWSNMAGGGMAGGSPSMMY